MLSTIEKISPGKRRPPQHNGPANTRDGFPVIKRNARGKKDGGRAKRILISSQAIIPPLREEDENRPDTPLVGTRHERYLLQMEGRKGNGRPQVPCDTQDIFADNGMYKRKMVSTPRHSPMKNKVIDGSRCPTPVPFDQPLTRLCWDTGYSKDYLDDTEDEDELTTCRENRVPYTPRNQVMNPLMRQLRSRANDITVSDLEDFDESEEKILEPLNLTQKVLQSHFKKKLDNTQRIVRWLVDCEEKSNISSLPAHLPDISYRNVTLSIRHDSSENNYF